MLLAVGLGGVAQVVARYWLASGSSIPRDTAVQLLTSLAWRGIAGFPLHGSRHHCSDRPRHAARSPPRVRCGRATAATVASLRPG